MSVPRLRDSHIHLETGKRSKRLEQAPVGGLFPAGLDHNTPVGRMSHVVSECLSDTHLGGAEWADIRFNPLSWVERGVAPSEQLRLLQQISLEVREKLGTGFAIFITLKQEGSEEEWRESLDFALAGRDSIVAGIDISRSYDVSNPREVPADKDLRRLKHICREARQYGLTVAVHCGWFDSQADLLVALDTLGATRIGHGLPAARERTLLKRIADANVLMEVCPTAFMRRCHTDFATHPLTYWLDEGIQFGIGTDHPVVFSTDIGREYALVRDLLPLRTDG